MTRIEFRGWGVASGRESIEPSPHPPTRSHLSITRARAWARAKVVGARSRSFTREQAPTPERFARGRVGTRRQIALGG